MVAQFGNMRVATGLLVVPLMGGLPDEVDVDDPDYQSEYYLDYFRSYRNNYDWSNTWNVGSGTTTWTTTTSTTSTTTTTTTTPPTTTTTTPPTITPTTKSIVSWDKSTETTWPKPETNGTTVPLDEAGGGQLESLIGIIVFVSVVVLAIGIIVVSKLAARNCKKTENPNETEMTILPPNILPTDKNEVKIEAITNPYHQGETAGRPKPSGTAGTSTATVKVEAPETTQFFTINDQSGEQVGSKGKIILTPNTILLKIVFGKIPDQKIF